MDQSSADFVSNFIDARPVALFEAASNLSEYLAVHDTKAIMSVTENVKSTYVTP